MPSRIARALLIVAVIFGIGSFGFALAVGPSVMKKPVKKPVKRAVHVAPAKKSVPKVARPLVKPKSTATTNQGQATKPVVSNPLRIISPNGGGLYVAGTILNIEWSGGIPTQMVDVMLVPASGASGLAPSTIASRTPNDGSVAWFIPALQASGQYVVRVCQEALCASGSSDVSDAPLTIFVSYDSSS